MRIPVRVIKRMDADEPDDERMAGNGMAWPEDSIASPEEGGSESGGGDGTGADEARDERPAAKAVARDDLSGPEDDGWKNKYVRLLADFENYKRHAESERERLSGMGKESVLDDLFPLVEHMERAIQSARDAGGGNGILQGLEMVYRELLNVLEKHGVERIRVKGELFDPRFHEAAATLSSPDHPEGAILEELRPGFTRQGRLLRPATVVVAR